MWEKELDTWCGKCKILRAKKLKRKQKNGLRQGFWSCEEGDHSLVDQERFGSHLEKTEKFGVKVGRC